MLLRPDDFRKVIDSDLTDVFTIAPAAVRGMKETRSGTNVNIAPILGSRDLGQRAVVDTPVNADFCATDAGHTTHMIGSVIAVAARHQVSGL